MMNSTKKRTVRKRPKIGDVVEIRTSKGFSYAQYTHKDPSYGELIRVFKYIFQERPSSFKELVQGDIQFMTFFPLGIYVHRGSVGIVTHEDIPEHAQKFPVFKANNGVAADGYIYWWLWDGEKSWQIGTELTEEQKHYPDEGVINDIALLNCIEKDWTHEGWPDPENPGKRVWYLKEE
jgi:hypothetical protein